MKKLMLFVSILFALTSNTFSQVHQQQNRMVRITSPINNSTVEQEGNTVEFSTSTTPALGASLVVFVRDPNGRYWPYVGPDHDNNRWTMQNVQYGVAQDHSRNFEITVIILSDILIRNGMQYHGATVYIENNTPITQGGFNFLLNRYTHSQTVITRRD